MLSSLLFFASLLSVEAVADCPTSFKGADYSQANGTNCPVGGTAVCAGSANVITCDLSGSGTGATLFIVEDYDTAATDYEAWGTYDGSKFCCVITEYSGFLLNTVDVLGSEENDSINLSALISSTTYNLQPTASVGLLVTVEGGDGEDTIHGSNANTSYDEVLYGDNDTDYIYGHSGDDEIWGGGSNDDDSPDYLYGQAGDDFIYGEGGNDTISGGNGVDYLSGGEGDDIMIGGPGNDTMYGREDDDRMAGNSGDDTMDGGTGADVLCGGPDILGDTLSDGDSDSTVDKLWGAEDLDDTVNCNDASTLTDNQSNASTSCTTSLTAPPSTCP